MDEMNFVRPTCKYSIVCIGGMQSTNEKERVKYLKINKYCIVIKILHACGTNIFRPVSTYYVPIWLGVHAE